MYDVERRSDERGVEYSIYLSVSGVWRVSFPRKRSHTHSAISLIHPSFLRWSQLFLLDVSYVLAVYRYTPETGGLSERGSVALRRGISPGEKMGEEHLSNHRATRFESHLEENDGEKCEKTGTRGKKIRESRDARVLVHVSVFVWRYVSVKL